MYLNFILFLFFVLGSIYFTKLVRFINEMMIIISQTTLDTYLGLVIQIISAWLIWKNYPSQEFSKYMLEYVPVYIGLIFRHIHIRVYNRSLTILHNFIGKLSYPEE